MPSTMWNGVDQSNHNQGYCIMADIIDFSQYQKKVKPPAPKKPVVRSQMNTQPGTGRKCRTKHLTWLEFMTPPAYVICFDDQEGPQNDPDGFPPGGRKIKPSFNNNSNQAAA